MSAHSENGTKEVKYLQQSVLDHMLYTKTPNYYTNSKSGKYIAIKMKAAKKPSGMIKMGPNRVVRVSIYVADSYS